MSAMSLAGFRHFQKLALPVTLQVLFMSARNIADILLIAMLGSVAVASAGLSGKAILVGMVALGGLVSGSSVLGAQYAGAGDDAGLRRTILQGMLVSLLLVALPVWLLFNPGADGLMALASEDGKVVTQAASYLAAFSWAFVFLAINNVLAVALRVCGEASAATWVSFAGVALNVVLAYLLIFGHGGLPELGMNGAAWATAISAALEAALLWGLLARRRTGLLPQRSDLARIGWPSLRHYLSIALPATLNGLLWATGIFVYSVIYGRMGTRELAVMAALTPLESFAAAVEQGLATATAILLGQKLGKEDYASARRHCGAYLKYSIATSLALGLVLLALMPWFLQAFGLDDARSDTAIQVYLVMVLTFWVKTVNAVGIGGVLRSGGDLGAGIRIDLIGQWGVGIPLALFGAFVLQLPLPLVFALVMLEDISKAFLTSARIRCYFWLRKLT